MYDFLASQIDRTFIEETLCSKPFKNWAPDVSDKHCFSFERDLTWVVT